MEKNPFVEEQWHPVATEAVGIPAKSGSQGSENTAFVALVKAAETLRDLFPMLICLNPHFPYRIMLWGSR